MARTTATGQANLSIPDRVSVTLIVNGAERNLSVVPWTTLLDALREHLHLPLHALDRAHEQVIGVEVRRRRGPQPARMQAEPEDSAAEKKACETKGL